MPPERSDVLVIGGGIAGLSATTALAEHRRVTLLEAEDSIGYHSPEEFAPDRRPVAGFAPDAPGFFWLAGQGGFGLQTSPVMAAITT